MHTSTPRLVRSAALAATVAAAVAGCGRGDDKAASGNDTLTPADPDFLTKGQKLYSQHNEELVIRHFFQDRKGGFFLDVGSAHYKNLSTTYYLDHHLEWKGIAIDALPEYGAEYAEHRPDTKFFSYLVSDKSDETEKFFRAKHLREVSSTSKELTNELSERYKGKGGVEETEVKTITLDDLLDREGVTKVDFLSMDIEGSEPPALSAFDIERFKPDLVCIEAHHGIGEKLLEYFKSHGYERIDEYLKHDQINWYFRPKAR